MPRPRPPHLHRQITQHGKAVWYVRKGHGPRTRIRAAFGTSEFEAEYQAAINGQGRLRAPNNDCPFGTLAWLIARYREAAAWQQDLSAATRRQRENIFRQVILTAGNEPYASITQAIIIKGRDRREKTPHQARHFLDAMRGLFRWALKAKHVKVDPTASVNNPTRKEGPGFKMWSEPEMAAYEVRWPIGTRQRVWLDVLAYTGLRRGDAVRLSRQHVRNGIAKLKTEKTGIEVTLPILPILQRTLDAGPCGDLTFIVGANGKPLTKEAFGNLFRKACNEAGVSGSAHGVRKIAATRAAENGATVAQLKAIFGWTDDAMPSHYTREADRVRLAKEGICKLVNETGISIPSPRGEVREPEGKIQIKSTPKFDDGGPGRTRTSNRAVMSR